MKKTKTSPAFSNAFLDQLLSGYETPGDWNQVQYQLDSLKSALVERLLQGEMTNHLGYPSGEEPPLGNDNRRNGTSLKTVQTDSGEMTLNIPRDRSASFDPVAIKKYQRRLPGFDEKVIALYARGLSTRDIQGFLFEIYGTDVSSELISDITDEILAEVTAWQTRPLESHYPILYLDGIRVKIRDSGHILNKTIYLAIGVDMDGKKEVLGIWVAKTEGSKFWLSIITELKNRGVDDIFIACCDGLTGLPDAINAVFPQTTVQLCIVHMIRNSLKYVAWKDYRGVTRDLKLIYAAANEAAAKEALEAFQITWNDKYPTIAPMWIRHWDNIAPFLAYPKDIRRVIYTTNTIEAINRQIRKVIKTKGSFPSDDAACKLIYMALQNANLSAIMPVKEWKLALAQFAIIFHDRLPA